MPSLSVSPLYFTFPGGQAAKKNDRVSFEAKNNIHFIKYLKKEKLNHALVSLMPTLKLETVFSLNSHFYQLCLFVIVRFIKNYVCLMAQYGTFPTIFYNFKYQSNVR